MELSKDGLEMIVQYLISRMTGDTKVILLELNPKEQKITLIDNSPVEKIKMTYALYLGKLPNDIEEEKD